MNSTTLCDSKGTPARGRCRYCRVPAPTHLYPAISTIEGKNRVPPRFDYRFEPVGTIVRAYYCTDHPERLVATVRVAAHDKAGCALVVSECQLHKDGDAR